VQGASHAQRALPDARRRQYGPTNPERSRAIATRKLEAWFVFRGFSSFSLLVLSPSTDYAKSRDSLFVTRVGLIRQQA
jgi:hypothetical protein